MEKEFIPYEQALILKELGFDEPCFGWYASDKSLIKDYVIKMHLKAPLYQQAFRWFREKYNLTSWVYNSDVDKFFYTILQNGRIIKAHDSVAIYEEAELACLIKLIEIVKQ